MIHSHFGLGAGASNTNRALQSLPPQLRAVCMKGQRSYIVHLQKFGDIDFVPFFLVERTDETRDGTTSKLFDFRHIDNFNSRADFGDGIALRLSKSVVSGF